MTSFVVSGACENEAVSDVRREAEMSPDGIYRYRLSRTWDDTPHATFIMLNPSIADAMVDDRTIKRCMSFARGWGLGGINVVNLYALRSTDPNGLWCVADPVGPDNDQHLRDAGSSGALLVAAWGAHAKKDRIAEVLALPGFEKLTCLATTKAGQPRHPLYLDGGLTPVPWPA